jgi:hypothetical protein
MGQESALPHLQEKRNLEVRIEEEKVRSQSEPKNFEKRRTKNGTRTFKPQSSRSR